MTRVEIKYKYKHTILTNKLQKIYFEITVGENCLKSFELGGHGQMNAYIDEIYVNNKRNKAITGNQ